MRRSPLCAWQTPVVGLLLAAIACSPRGHAPRTDASPAVELLVTLSQTPDVAPGHRRGMSNILFDSVPPSLKDSVRTGDGWHAVEVAEIVASSGMQSIRAVRFTRAHEKEPQYVIDTAGSLDFRDGRLLTFERHGAIRVANVDLRVRSLSGSERRVPYQVLVADDGYTYARIADYRTGTFQVDGKTYAVSVRNRGRSRPFYQTGEYTVFYVDLDADGVFAEQAALTVAGRAVAVEQVMPHRPFILNGRVFEIVNVDSGGNELRLSPSKRSAAMTVGFRAPEIRADLLKGGDFRLSNQIGKVVLIEFWATDCPYSEKVRDGLNALAASRGERFTWIAVSKEHVRAPIEQHLIKAPMHATITLADSAASEIYNPAGATPLFVVVDQRGMIQFTAVGASAMDAVTATVDRLLQSSPPQ